MLPDPAGAASLLGGGLVINTSFYVCISILASVGVLVAVWLVTRTDFLACLSRHVCRWAPLYLILGPPALTYIIACGFCSMTYLWYIDSGDQFIWEGLSRDEILASQRFRGLHVIEWVCGMVGAFASAWVVHSLRLPTFWYGVVLASMSLTAVYRTAACRLDPVGGFGSGPDFLVSPTLMDALPVLVGMSIFYVFRQWRFRRPGERSNAADSR